MVDKKRIEWIDVLKGIGIVLVVIGHSFRDEMREISHIADFIYSYIYIFHMPLFFSISGYVFGVNYEKYRKVDFKMFIRNKAKGYMLPFISYSLFIYLFFYIVNLVPLVRTVIKNSSISFVSLGRYLLLCLQCNNPYAFHLWYFLVLFIVVLVSFLLLKIEVSLGIKKGILLLVLAFGLWNVRIFLLNDSIMLFKLFTKFFVFFLWGMFYSKQRKSKGYFIYSFLSWGYCVLYVLNYFNAMIGVFWYLKNLLLLICTVNIVDNFFWLSQNICNNKMLRYIGENSVCYYMFHQPFCCAFLGALLYNKFNCSILVTCVVCIVMSILFPTLIIVLKKRCDFIKKILACVFGI